MATNSAPFPASGESPYGPKVKVYIDTGDAAVETAAKADATAKVTAHEGKANPHQQYDRLLAPQQSGVQDANTFTTPGRYYILSNGANTNFPSISAGFLEVVARENQGVLGPNLTQAYQHRDTGLYYTRSLGSGDTWSAWQKTSVSEHEAESNPHSQYARLAASNTFSNTQIVANNGIQQVLRRTNAPTDSQVWVTSVETDGTLKFRPYNDTVSAVNGAGFDVFRDGKISRGGIFEITGTGDPNGVHAAPVGSVFRNTEAGGWNGARVWRKDAGGTGVNGWVVELGDTGVRDVTNLLPSGFSKSATAGVATIQRIGERVSIEIKVSIASGASSSTIFTSTPVGFQSSAYAYPPGLYGVSALQPGASALRPLADRAGLLSPGAAGPGTGALTPFEGPFTIAWSLSYLTVQSWPATLPGTPA